MSGPRSPLARPAVGTQPWPKMSPKMEVENSHLAAAFGLSKTASHLVPQNPGQVRLTHSCPKKNKPSAAVGWLCWL